MFWEGNVLVLWCGGNQSWKLALSSGASRLKRSQFHLNLNTSLCLSGEKEGGRAQERSLVPCWLAMCYTSWFSEHRASCPVSIRFPNSDPQCPRQWGEKAICRFGCIVEFFLGLKIQDQCLSDKPICIICSLGLCFSEPPAHSEFCPLPLLCPAAWHVVSTLGSPPPSSHSLISDWL